MEIIEKYFDDFSIQQKQQFAGLGDLYKDWNSKINVISRKDIDSLYTRHILHSLAIAAIINFADGARIVDIGTGGGFPGVPLAIMFPNCHFTLVDSIGKKLKIVDDISEKLNIRNITTIHSRVEKIPQQKFDYAVSRAVAPLGDLWKWIRPFIEKGRQTEEFANGLFCLKGGDLNEEISKSGLRPHIWPLIDIFPEPIFEEKYILYTPYK